MDPPVTMTIDKNILFIDAYDSFAQSIVALLSSLLSASITYIKIDTDVQQRFNCTLEELILRHHAVVLGPGPGDPYLQSDIGHHLQVWKVATLHRVPVLGICLGFQTMCLTFGLQVERMPLPCHGQVKKIIHCNTDILKWSGDVSATNYNSLAVRCPLEVVRSSEISRPSSSSTNSSFATNSSNGAESSKSLVTDGLGLNTDIEILARDDNGYIMAARHRVLPIWGLQFHPESCKSSDSCGNLISTWWTKVADHHKWVRRFDQAALHSSFPEPKEIVASVPMPSSRNVDPSRDKLRVHLRNIGVATSQTVHSVAVQTSLSRDQVSTICFGMSRPEHIAMLDSSRKGQFNIYAIPSSGTCTVEVYDRICTINQPEPSSTKSLAADPCEVMEAIAELIVERKVTGGHPGVPFWGGFLGYLSYEHGLDMLDLANAKHQNPKRKIPEISMLWTERSVVFDQQHSTIYVQSVSRGDQKWVESMAQHFATFDTSILNERYEAYHETVKRTLQSTEIQMPSHSRYTRQMKSCQEQLRSGNSYELCLTTEAIVRTPFHPVQSMQQPTQLPRESYALYRNLHHFNPVPFGAFVQLNEVTILGTSPEQYLSWSRHGTIDMVPMKGTVKRSPEMTLARATEILSSPKEHGENLMIADLIRHDLYSTVGWTSKVDVVKLCEVIEHETVYQLVSHIRAHAPIARPPPDSTGAAKDWEREQAIHYGHKALRQTFPPGSMTGAPKKRSCEILSDLEQRDRGVYSGVLGFMDLGGGGNWNVCIRTAYSTRKEDTANAQTWHVGAGGAITVLSDVEAEYEEMRVKLDSVLRGFREVPDLN